MRSDLDEFMEQLNLEDEVFDDQVIDENDPEINESVRWLALARVHTNKTFSPAALYKDMRAVESFSTGEIPSSWPKSVCCSSLLPW